MHDDIDTETNDERRETKDNHMVKKNGESEILRCSFCNKDQNDVRKLIAGPTVFICDECVEVCQDIVSGKYDEPSASDDIAPIAWLQWGRQMTKCRTCGPPGQVHFAGYPLREYVARAYGVRVSQVIGPAWISERF